MDSRSGARDAPAEPPDVVLIRGCPRSGTTLLTELINSSSAAAVMFEYSLGALVRDLQPILAYGFAQRASYRRSNDAARALPAGLIAWGNAGSGAGDRADQPVAYLNERQRRFMRYPTVERLSAIVTAVVEASLCRHGVRLIGSKTPGAVAVRDRAVLEPLFPRIKYVFAVRNPLDTINSIINRRNLARLGADTWAYADVGQAVREYRHNVRLLLSHLAAFPGACLVVKYEDLLASFGPTTRTLEGFLGVTLFESATPADFERRKATRTVLTAAEEAHVRAEFGDAIAAWDGKRLTGTGTSAAADLADCVDRIQPGRTYRYADGEERHFLGLGWNDVEPEGVWSNDRTADVFFRPERDGDYALSAQLSCLIAGAQARQTVTVSVDGATVCSSVFAGDTPQTVVTAPLRLRAGRATHVTFAVDAIRSPLELGVSSDDRELGVFLRSLTLHDTAADGDGTRRL